MSALEDAVTEGPDGWAFRCPGFADNFCGNWSSSQWPTKKLALARGREHLDEHAEYTAAMAEGRDPDPSMFTTQLHVFREKHGLTVNDDGSVSA